MMISTIKVVFFVFCLLIASVTSAQIGVSGAAMELPPSPVCTDIQLMKSIPCSDKELFFHKGQGIVQQAFNESNFKFLNDTYEHWCTGKDRFPDGRWFLSQYGSGLKTNFLAWKAWDNDLRKIKKWQAEFPNHESAKFVEGVYWYAYAWSARGDGYSNSVSKEGQQLFRERLTASKNIFGEIIKSKTTCPAAYSRMLDVMVEVGAKESDIYDIYIEGAKKFPQYHSIYFSMARYYEPIWHGSADAYELFANQVVEKTKNFEGNGMYARLYWLVDSADNLPFEEKLNSPPYWKKLKLGYEDLLRLYPSSIHNMGKYAGVACRSSDSGLYLTLRKKIDGYQNGADFYDSVDVCDLRHGWKK